MKQPNVTSESKTEEFFKLTVKSPGQTLQIAANSTTSVRLALDTTSLRVRAACGGLGTCGACLIQLVCGDFNPPTVTERQRILPEDLASGMRLACQLRPRSNGELFLEYPAPHSEWKSLDASDLYEPSHHYPVDHHVYGVAVDLGTTQIRLSLWNRKTGRRIATRYGINPQIAYGADVLTRLDADRLGDFDKNTLTQLARKAIIDGLRDILCRDMGEVSPILNEIGKVLIVGNTAMLTLFCGENGDNLYQPENWQQSIHCQLTDVDSLKLAWRTPHANIAIAQPLAGFIGSDLLADLLATAITEQSEPIMLADFGTNTEIALWDGRTLWATSVPGGPAFEGIGLRNGMSGEAGAISKVIKVDGAWQYQTISNASPRGFCASGYVDAIAMLVNDQSLKASGRFAEPLSTSGFRLDADNAHTAIYGGDVDLFQRAKAATAAAMSQLLAMSGLSKNDLHKLWICGCFGQHLNLPNAIALGLLPDIITERIRVLPNASLAGCEKLLLNQDSENLVKAIYSRIHVINLSCVAEYEERFINNLLLKPMPIEEHD